MSEFSYLLESLLSYTEYTFSLSSNYAGNASDVIMASSTTDEDSKRIDKQRPMCSRALIELSFKPTI